MSSEAADIWHQTHLHWLPVIFHLLTQTTHTQAEQNLKCHSKAIEMFEFFLEILYFGRFLRQTCAVLYLLCLILVKIIHHKHKTPSCLLCGLVLVVTTTKNNRQKTFIFWQVNRSKVIFSFWLPCPTNAPQEWLRDGCSVPPRFPFHQLSAHLLTASLGFFSYLFYTMYLALRSRSPCGQSRLAWCSWCRSQHCPLSSSAACPGAMSRRQSCPCTTQLRWGKKTKNTFFFFCNEKSEACRY